MNDDEVGFSLIISPNCRLQILIAQLSERAMSDLKDNDKTDSTEFCWGKKKGRGGVDKSIQFYASFRYDGVEYFLYDSVYLFKKGEKEPYVGKLLKAWENAERAKKVKILWFFRPSEISNYLNGVDVLHNELFLASGEGKGLSNVNPLEAIAGKCDVVCISKDARNRQPSVLELEMADFVFYRTFDVQNLTISDTLDEKIALVEVKVLLNNLGLNPADHAKLDNGDVAENVQKQIVSVRDTLAADKSLELDSSTASIVVKGDEVANISGGVGGNVECDTNTSSLLVDGDEKLYEKVQASKPDNRSPVALPAAEQGSNPGQKVRPRSPASEKVDKPSVNVLMADNRKSEPANVVKRPIADGENVKLGDRLSKKLKVDATVRISSLNGAVGTPKSANASVANKAVQPAGTSRDYNERGKLGKDSGSICGGLSEQHKAKGVAEDKSDPKMNKARVKESTDPTNPADKTPQRPGGPAASFNHGGKSLTGSNVSRDIICKKRKLEDSVKPTAKLQRVVVTQPKDEEVGAYGRIKDVTQRPSDKSKWFTQLPWEERLKEAHEQGTLVLLQNLDPTYSSSEVENIIWHAFKVSCTARMVQRTATSSPFSGQAFAVFKTEETAQKVIRKLDRDCLMLPNGRTLVGTKGVVSLPRKYSQFFGHLAIDKIRHQMQRESREAVSTSHSSQSNTLEYDMAIEWRLLQERSDLWWKKLYKNQGEEMRKLNLSLKSKYF